MKVCLVGNQNSGKTSLFNCLTGANQKVGNWAGVTVEIKKGIIKNTEIEIVDLPGIYSISPYTKEEDLAQKYIFQEKPDILINVIDATSLERSLYLTTQLLELDTNIIIVLNMIDCLENKGIAIEIELMKQKLGVSICGVSVLKNRGISELIKQIRDNEVRRNQVFSFYPYDVEMLIQNQIKKENENHKRFKAIKKIEESDSNTFNYKKLKEKYQMDPMTLIAKSRYDYVEKMIKEIVTKKKVKESISDDLDKFFLNRYLAIPIFILILSFVYFFAIGSVGGALTSFFTVQFARICDTFRQILMERGVSLWLVSLLVDGICNGISSVLVFLPQLVLLFFSMAILESTGYMARIAFFLDKVFVKIGLSGKSIIPFIIGSGCSVPGVMSTRIIENEKERNFTIFLTPFVPCSAKLPIIVVFSSVFFPRYKALMVFLTYCISACLIIGLAYIGNKMTKQTTDRTLLFELPNYHLPNVKYVTQDVILKSGAFVRRAGTIIFISSIVVWVLKSFSWQLEYGVSIEQSMLASIGNFLAWFFYPILGKWSWELSVSALQGLIAKEQVISSLHVIAGNEMNELMFQTTYAWLSTPAAMGFMVFNLFSAPCISTLATIKKELGSTKKMLLMVGLQILIAWILAVLVKLGGDSIQIWIS